MFTKMKAPFRIFLPVCVATLIHFLGITVASEVVSNYGVILYEHSDYQGQSIMLDAPGDYDISFLLDRGLNDAISSMTLADGWRIELCMDSSFANCQAFDGPLDTTSFATTWLDDHLSSFRLVGPTYSPSAGVSPHTIKYGRKVMLKLDKVNRFLSGARGNGNEGVVTKDYRTDSYEENVVYHYEWVFQSEIDLEPKIDTCVKYGDIAYLRNNVHIKVPSLNRWLTGARGVNNEEVYAKDVVSDPSESALALTHYRFIIRSTLGNGIFNSDASNLEPRLGECITENSVFYLQVSDNRWLNGARSGNAEVVRTRDATTAAEPSKVDVYYRWHAIAIDGTMMIEKMSNTELPQSPSIPEVTGPFYIEVTARFNKIGTGTVWQRIFDFGNGSDQQNIYLTQIGDSSDIQARFYDENNAIHSLTSVGAITVGETATWKIGIDHDGTFTLYKNRILLDSKTGVPLPSKTTTRSNKLLGESNWPGDTPLDGSILGIKVVNLNERLGLNEIDLWNVPSQIMTTPMFVASAYVRFDDTSKSYQRVFDFGLGEANNVIFFSQYGSTTDVFFGVVQDGASISCIASNAIVQGETALWRVEVHGTTYRIQKNGITIKTCSHMLEPNLIFRTNTFIGKSNWNENDDLDGVVLGFRLDRTN